MSFWKSEMGEVTGDSKAAFVKQSKNNGNRKINEGKITPGGTKVLASIHSFKNGEYTPYEKGERLDNMRPCLEIEWVITDGAHENNLVRQRLKVFEPNPALRHKALNMLRLIYNIFNIDINSDSPPTDDDLSVFIGREAGIRVEETSPNAEGKTFNWVSEVHDAKGFKPEEAINISIDDDFEDDIPF